MTIAEVSKQYNISADTLRYYERVGIIPPVERTPGGNRNYTEESCNWIELALCMRSAGIPIESLVEYCQLTLKGDATISARKELLEEERRKLVMKMEDLNRTLERLNYKISRYETAERSGALSWDKCPDQEGDDA